MDKLQQATEALKQGDKATALQLLSQFIQTEPRNEGAWLLLSRMIGDPGRRRDCLRRVLVLNPQNVEAKKELLAMDRPVVSLAVETGLGLETQQRKATGCCPHCGATTQRGKKFCATCGVELAAPVGTKARRQQHEVTPASDESPVREAVQVAKAQRQAATKTDTMNRGQLITLLGAIGLVIGALLPWATVTSIFGSMSVNGYEGDGIFSGGIGLLILVSALLTKGKSGKLYSVAGAIFGIIAGLLVSWKIADIGSMAAESTDFVRASVGSGLYLSAVGAILVVVGGFQRTSKTTE